MYQKILNFIKYNNAFTIIFGLFFFGFGVTFAASPQARDSVYSSTETIVSVDNSLVVATNLDAFNFNLRINGITEDEKNYYAVYSYRTMTIENGVWIEKPVTKTLNVNKEALDGKDLGLYVAKELGENMNYELSYLKRVQKTEQEKGQSQKVVSTEYSGLVGKLLDTKEQVIEGYEPVVPEPEPALTPAETAAVIQSSPQEVIVSVPQVAPQQNIVPEQTQSQSVVTSVATTTSDPVVSSVATTTSEIVNPDLVQEVVGQMLPDTATDIPTTETVPAQ